MAYDIHQQENQYESQYHQMTAIDKDLRYRSLRYRSLPAKILAPTRKKRGLQLHWSTNERQIDRSAFQKALQIMPPKAVLPR
jgi:hypothetical protein